MCVGAMRKLPLIVWSPVRAVVGREHQQRVPGEAGLVERAHHLAKHIVGHRREIAVNPGFRAALPFLVGIHGVCGAGSGR